MGDAEFFDTNSTASPKKFYRVQESGFVSITNQISPMHDCNGMRRRGEPAACSRLATRYSRRLLALTAGGFWHSLVDLHIMIMIKNCSGDEKQE